MIINQDIVDKTIHRMKFAKVNINSTEEVISFLGEEVERYRRRIENDEEWIDNLRDTNRMQARDISFWKTKYEDAVKDKGIIASFDRSDLKEARESIENIKEEIKSLQKLFGKYWGKTNDDNEDKA